MSSIFRLPNLALEGVGFDTLGLRHPTPTDIGEQLVNTRQYFPDNSIEGARIENLSVAKLKAGELTIGSNIRSGQTAYDTGTGFFIGNDSGVSRFSIGNSAGNKLTWDGSTLSITGSITATTGTIGGFTIGAIDLSVVFGGNTTTVSSGATAFSAGPTGSPTVTITRAGVLTATGAVINGSPVSNNDTFGSGFDGAFALDGTNTYATNMSKSGSDYTLIRDVFATTLTLSGTATLTTNGYRLFVNGTLTLGASNVIKWNGVAGSNASGQTGGAGGTALSSNNTYGSLAGVTGGTGGATGGGAPTKTNGTAITNSFQTAFTDVGGQGGAGGGTGSGSQASGTVGTISASYFRPYSSSTAVLMLDFSDSATPKFLKFNGHGGGSCGGQGGANSAGVGGVGGGGGGNGSNGGVVVICARLIVNAGAIQANGGAGGNGANGANGTGGPTGGGGGGGGGAGLGGSGGVLILIYSSLTGAGTTTASAGANGTFGAGGSGSLGGATGSGGGDANSGLAATAGVVVQLQV